MNIQLTDPKYETGETIQLFLKFLDSDCGPKMDNLAQVESMLSFSDKWGCWRIFDQTVAILPLFYDEAGDEQFRETFALAANWNLTNVCVLAFKYYAELQNEERDMTNFVLEPSEFSFSIISQIPMGYIWALDKALSMYGWEKELPSVKSEFEKLLKEFGPKERKGNGEVIV